MNKMQISLRVRCHGLDQDGVMGLTRNLREGIFSVDVDDVQLDRSGPAPAGAKSGEAIAVGALIVALGPSVIGPLMVAVSSWLSRQPGDVEVEIDGRRFKGRVTAAQRDELVTAYLRRLDGGS